MNWIVWHSHFLYITQRVPFFFLMKKATMASNRSGYRSEICSRDNQLLCFSKSVLCSVKRKLLQSTLKWQQWHVCGSRQEVSSRNVASEEIRGRLTGNRLGSNDPRFSSDRNAKTFSFWNQLIGIGKKFQIETTWAVCTSFCPEWSSWQMEHQQC